jgi:hypothetical protein
VAAALPTEPYIPPPFIAAILCLYLQQYADIHSNGLPITNILYKDISLGNVSGYLYIPIFCYNSWISCLVSGTFPNKRNTTQRTEQLPKRTVGIIKHKARTG